MKAGSPMSPDRGVLIRALLAGLVLAVLAGPPRPAHGQASMVSPLAGASLAPGPGGGAGAALAGPTAVRVGAPAAAGDGPPGGGAAGSGAAGGSAISVSTAEVANLVRAAQGRATVVILYGTNCPRSHAMFPGFTALAARHAPRNVRFLTFAADQRAQDVPPFLAEFGAPFTPYHITRRVPGELSRDLGPLGLHVEGVWNMPHVAVLDGSGRVVGEWDGATNLRAIDAALSSLR